MKKLICLCLILMLIPIKSFALSAKSSILMDVETNRVILESNAYSRRGMASTTKIMTAIVAIEKGNLSDIVTVSQNAASVEGSSMWLKQGEKISLESLLYGLMLNSGNDAATAIAEHIGGSVEGFADLMNEKARELNLKDTSFTNPHGLDNKNHYTTAYDLAIISCYALKNDKFADIVMTKRKTLKSLDDDFTRTLKNHNKMLSIYDNADGVKTGFTKKCGRCLVSSATKNGLQLVAVTLNAPDDWNDHSSMLDYGFNNYYSKSLIKKGSYIKSMAVKNGTDSRLNVVCNDEIKTTLKNEETAKLIYNIPDEITAPITINQKVGEIYLLVDNKKIKTYNAVSKYGVPKKITTRYRDIFVFLVYSLLDYFK